MPPKSDPSQLAGSIVTQSTASNDAISLLETPEELAVAITKPQEEGKDGLTVQPSQRGEKSGGRANANRSSNAGQSEIRKNASKARWVELTRQIECYESLLKKREELTKQIGSIDDILPLFAPRRS